MSIKVIRIELLWYYLHLQEKVQWAIARALPRWLVGLALARAGNHGTSGRWEGTDVADVRLTTIMKRWDSANDGKGGQ